METKNKASHELQHALDESEDEVSKLKDRVSALEDELEEERDCNRHLEEQVDTLEKKNLETEQDWASAFSSSPNPVSKMTCHGFLI